MQQLCKPLEIDALGDPIYDNSPAKFERLYQYNAVDVRAEMEIDALLPELPPSERKVWELDLIMNRRGVQIDQELCLKAATISNRLILDLNTTLHKLTNGAVDKATRVTALKRYLDTVHGIKVDSLDKVGVTDLLASPNTPPLAKEVINVRRQVGKSTSIAKYEKALEMACADGRVRGSLQYHAAHTGRWGGRLIQPQNMPKGFGEAEQTQAIAWILTGDDALFALAYGDKAMDALSDSLRGIIVAGSQKRLVCGDYNAIEARVLFWLANEQGALAAYRRGDSPYVDLARFIYRNEAITKKTHPKEYDIGKRSILGCGYGMGAEKFRDNVYAETAKMGNPTLISPELAERAVKAYRERYNGVIRMWYEVEAAAINAVRNPEKRFSSCGGHVLWGMSQDKRFLVCRLPSGRYLWYWKPAVIKGWRIFCKDENCVHWKEMDESKCPTRKEQTMLTYWGEHPKTHQWCQLNTYGGALTENITQAIARDIMVNGMLNCEAAGYEMELTVHDELIAEVPAGGPASDSMHLKDFMQLMCQLPSWADGCPIAAEGWVGKRYRK